jgi:hypothetical protein
VAALLRRAPAAVYLSESDAVATSEVTGRKKRLGGAALINVDKYPRVVFAVGFDLTRVSPANSAEIALHKKQSL